MNWDPLINALSQMLDDATSRKFLLAASSLATFLFVIYYMLTEMGVLAPWWMFTGVIVISFAYIGVQGWLDSLKD